MGSISAILRIQEVYKLSACVAADGKLHAGNNSGRLGADECYELGVVSDSKKNDDDVIECLTDVISVTVSVSSNKEQLQHGLC